MLRHERLIEVIIDSSLDDVTKVRAASDITMMVRTGQIEKEELFNGEEGVDILGSLFIWEQSEHGGDFWMHVYHEMTKEKALMAVA